MYRGLGLLPYLHSAPTRETASLANAQPNVEIRMHQPSQVVDTKRKASDAPANH
jgi:hypothetical protein